MGLSEMKKSLPGPQTESVRRGAARPAEREAGV